MASAVDMKEGREGGVRGLSSSVVLTRHDRFLGGRTWILNGEVFHQPLNDVHPWCAEKDIG